MNYSENFHGIEYRCKRGCILYISANTDDFFLSAAEGILNIFSTDFGGRTAIFINDVNFFEQTKNVIKVEVLPGTPSYMKELAKIRPLSKHEFDTHSIYKLW